MSLAGSRLLFSLVFLAGALASWAAFNLQYGGGLEPCPLWSVQRLLLVLFSAVNLVAALHGPKRLGCTSYWLLDLLLSLVGVITAGRHVLLQNIPSDQLLACLPEIPVMLGNTSWMNTLRLVYKGTADCAEVTWSLLDMSVPEWSLLFFVAMMILSLYRLLRLLRSSRRTASLP